MARQFGRVVFVASAALCAACGGGGDDASRRGEVVCTAAVPCGRDGAPTDPAEGKGFAAFDAAIGDQVAPVRPDAAQNATGDAAQDAGGNGAQDAPRPAVAPADGPRDAAAAGDAAPTRDAAQTQDGPRSDARPDVAPLRADFTACTANAECSSGLCREGLCTPPGIVEGLVAHLKLDETTGDRSADSSPSGLEGTWQGRPAPATVTPLVPFPDPGSLRFDGARDRVSVPDAPALRRTGDVTLAVWLWAAAPPTESARVLGKGRAANLDYGLFWEAGLPSRLTFRQTDAMGRTVASVRSTVRIDTVRWVHVAVTIEGNVVSLYVDGILDAAATRTGAPASTDGPLTLGCPSPPAGQVGCFGGLLDDVRIYDRALAPGSVRVLADARVLPVLWIEVGRTIPDEPKVGARLKVIEDHDGTLRGIANRAATFESPMGIEQHGDSSGTFPKKSYGIELRATTGGSAPRPLLGMPAESDWILSACYSDKTCLRNALTYDLGRAMGLWSPRTRFAEVFIDGRYEGLYTVTESIKAGPSRVPIPVPAAKATQGDLTGGYIFSRSGATRDFESKLGVLWTQVAPRRSRITPEQQAWEIGYIDRLEAMWSSAGWRDPKTGYRTWIDLRSWTDYLLMQELSRNPDAYYKSTHFTKQSDLQGGRLYLGPLWDFDIAYGNVDVYPRYLPRGWGYLENAPIAPPQAFFFGKIWTDPTFLDDLQCRWRELRKGPLDLRAIDQRLAEWASLLRRVEARDHVRWPVLGVKVWPNQFVGKTYSEELDYLREFIGKRLAFMDTDLPGSCAM